jgi:hypothetical protein
MTLIRKGHGNYQIVFVKSNLKKKPSGREIALFTINGIYLLKTKDNNNKLHGPPLLKRIYRTYYN